MRIVELRAENVKRLKAVEIRPDGDVVVIAGRNAQGKSSVLDAIWMALAGAAGAKETTRPIRDGEKQASVELDLGDLRVTRKWTEAGTTLVVASADGARYPSPQKVLDDLIGRLTFDPLAFAEQSEREQLATLLSVVELPFDPAQVAMQRQGIFDERTEVNREVKRLGGAISELPTPLPGTPDDEISVARLAEALAEAESDERNREDLERRIAGVEQNIRIAQEELDRLQKIRANLAEPIDPEPLRAELLGADETNANVRAKKELDRLAATHREAVERSNALTISLEEIDRQKELAISQAKMPLEGLAFNDDGVLFNGIPLSQVADSERLRVSIAIAMALNPKIRVIRITDGSLLDSENMKLIESMASEHDFQIWVERVDESGMVGITIEDGAVA